MTTPDVVTHDNLLKMSYSFYDGDPLIYDVRGVLWIQLTQSQYHWWLSYSHFDVLYDFLMFFIILLYPAIPRKRN